MAIFNSYVCLPDGIISNYCIEPTSIFPIGSPFTMDLPTTTQNLRFDGGHPRTPWSVHPKHCTWFITNIYMQLRRLYIYIHMYVRVLPIEPITRMHTFVDQKDHTEAATKGCWWGTTVARTSSPLQRWCHTWSPTWHGSRAQLLRQKDA